MSIGMDMDWTESRTITNFVVFRLNPDWKWFQKFRIRTGFRMR